ncbi:hypothetical protein EW145_g8370, partial [Phellinidium pouzarii]
MLMFSRKRFGDYIKNSHNPKEDTLPAKPLYRIFPKQPDEETLKEPSVHSEEEEEHYEKFRQIILTVEKKGDFSHDDEAFNGIAMWTGELPDFVKVVENKLKAKRDLPVRDKEALLREFDLSPNYDFGTSYDFTPLLEEERHGEELSELAHVMSSTGRHGGIEKWKKSLETAACSRFFFPVSDYMMKSLRTGRFVDCRFGSQSWLFSMLLKVKGEGNASYPYTPKSDFSVWKGKYPSLLCEIRSINTHDEARLHLQAAYCVRLANHQLQQENKKNKINKINKKKEAVIVIIYVSDDFKAHLHLFFEVEDGLPRRDTRSSHAAAAVAAAAATTTTTTTTSETENGPPAPTIFYT